MTEEVEEKMNVSPIRLFGMILPSLPTLMFKFGGVLLRFKRDAKKGGRIFQKELMSQGLDATTAAALTDIYLESSKLMHYLSFLRRALLKEERKSEK